MQISELLAVKRLHLRFLTGAEHAHRTVRWFYTTDLLEPARYLRGGEFILTGMMWRTRPEDSETFVSSIASAGAVALGAGTALSDIPPDLVEACRAHDIPLVEVPSETSFGAVTEEVLRALTQHRFTTISETRDRHRRVMAEVAAGADFPEAFAGAATQAGITSWVISSTGRRVASSSAPLSPDAAEWLAAKALTWPTFPRTVRLPGGDGAVVTVLPVQTKEAHPLATWLLVCAGDQGAWTEEEHESVAELVSVAVLARSRREERALTDARHLEGLPRLLAAQRFDEAGALMSGLGPDEDFAERGRVVVRAVMMPEPRIPDLTRRVLTELVADWPGAVVTGDTDSLAVVPVPDGVDARRGGEEIRARLVRRARVLEGGLLDYRIALGLSSAAHGVSELRGAAVEARHARRLAELRGGRSRVIAGAEIDSHELLLASVPEEVQSSYRERLLGPLIAYDRDHRSELVSTLEQFLEHSGSWQRCAAAMHVHVNTLRYRIGRVEELTGRDLSSLEHRVDLFLALKLRD
ncbi:PucR family transcriptional regulator ligand-binding domain-containing protein [Nocardiopsis sp. EMB25]|uniref:PucR family transcriptional regulator n=1 Tax=Nocardiopsis sp. EMB25 TaxID=2835867 RepID=UPI002284CA04|nr:PucR family transcriptional regulator [Nocardiopsis sp. EMB25]MCY9783588.1 PucR family transcriptional regulator ligand-binding domain-containing protein [Nocardiopsis sp. EMB25]